MDYSFFSHNGEEVQNRGEGLRVPLTREIIDDGKRFNCLRCPGALAITDALQQKLGAEAEKITVEASVNITRAWVFFTGEADPKTYVWKTPPALEEFMGNFDTFGPAAVGPMEFVLPWFAE